MKAMLYALLGAVLLTGFTGCDKQSPTPEPPTSTAADPVPGEAVVGIMSDWPQSSVRRSLDYLYQRIQDIEAGMVTETDPVFTNWVATNTWLTDATNALWIDTTNLVTTSTNDLWTVTTNWVFTWSQTNLDVYYIDVLTNGVPAWKEGRLFYDTDHKSLSFYTSDPTVTVNLINELMTPVRNTSGGTMTNGHVVRVVSQTGHVPDVALAQGNNMVNARVYGIITSDTIAHNAYGMATKTGPIHALDTSGAATAGAEGYLSRTTPGLITYTKPPADGTGATVFLGQVLTKHANQGIFDMMYPLKVCWGDIGGTNINLQIDLTNYIANAIAAAPGGSGTSWTYTGVTTNDDVTLTTNDSYTAYVYDYDGDVLFNLPTGAVGTTYLFVNTTTNLLKINAVAGQSIDDSDDDEDYELYSGNANEVNLWPWSAARLEQMTTNWWLVTYARGTWTTTGTNTTTVPINTVMWNVVPVTSTNDVTLTDVDSGSAYVYSGAGDVLFNLPTGTVGNVGLLFTFINTTTNLLKLNAGDSQSIDDSDDDQVYEMYSGANQLNKWPWSSCQLVLAESNWWHTVHARGDWTTTGTNTTTVPGAAATVVYWTGTNLDLTINDTGKHYVYTGSFTPTVVNLPDVDATTLGTEFWISCVVSGKVVEIHPQATDYIDKSGVGDKFENTNIGGNNTNAFSAVHVIQYTTNFWAVPHPGRGDWSYFD